MLASTIKSFERGISRGELGKSGRLRIDTSGRAQPSGIKNNVDYFAAFITAKSFYESGPCN